jgi:two-component system KDP operon response regulator KdpE
MKMLLVDRDPHVLETLSFTFRFLWPDVTLLTTSDGMKAIEVADSASPDVIVLELELPDMGGTDVVRQIRLFSDVPIVVLTNRDGEMDKVRSLEAGADDYIAKPFSPLDLLARTKAVLRRAGVLNADGEDLPPMVAGNLSIDFSTREISLDGKSVHLTPIEYKLLQVLVRNGGRVVTHEAFRRRVWGDAEYIDNSTIKKNIAQIRRKLGDTPGNPQMILNERGVGYKFIKPS